MGRQEIVLVVGLILLLVVVSTLLRQRAEGPEPRTNELLLWLAQGFGIGRIPWAPGTFGSLLGLAWFALLLASGQFWVLVGGALAGVGLSVWLCDVGEKVLGQKDPGSVVMDEVSAMPVCFLSWVAALTWRTGLLPGVDYFFSREHWPLTLGVFAAFRFFDVVKPWPVRQSQALPGGWGITIDDFLAALYVNVVMLAVYFGRSALA